MRTRYNMGNTNRRENMRYLRFVMACLMLVALSACAATTIQPADEGATGVTQARVFKQARQPLNLTK